MVVHEVHTGGKGVDPGHGNGHSVDRASDLDVHMSSAFGSGSCEGDGHGKAVPGHGKGVSPSTGVDGLGKGDGHGTDVDGLGKGGDDGDGKGADGKGMGPSKGYGHGKGVDGVGKGVDPSLGFNAPRSVFDFEWDRLGGGIPAAVHAMGDQCTMLLALT